MINEYDSTNGMYKVINHVVRPTNKRNTSSSFKFIWSHVLPQGGRVRLFLSLLKEKRRRELTDEVKHSQYLYVQCGHEPRVHFLLHKDASTTATTTDDDDDCVDADALDKANRDERPQPGYSYAPVKMKARSLHQFPHVDQLADEMRMLCGVVDWNIGLDVVLYRDGIDYIGFHADNNQGEDTILSLLVA